MQTFLPFPNFNDSAIALDDKRLLKQIVEVQQIYETIEDPFTRTAWQNHPAVNMWRGYEVALILYGCVCYAEWLIRNKRETIHASGEFLLRMWEKKRHIMIKYPKWLGSSKFHESHQSNLCRKDPYYLELFPNVDCNLEYVWPV